MTFLEAIILAIIEGLTEYLPVSSTGHLVIASSLMGISDQPFTKDFTVIVQFGAILSVLVLYYKRFMTSRTIYYKLFVAFLPVAVIGLALKDWVDRLLGDVSVVAWALIIGGVILLFIDRFFAAQEKRLSESKAGKIDTMTYKEAAFIGLFQCLALVPGVSRSASTIIGGLSQRLTREAAAEFSFLLAVPVLTAATCLKLLKVYKTIEHHQIAVLALGNLVSFIIGAITIRLFLGYLTKRGFFIFGIYRIIVGVVILVLIASGHELKLI